MTELSGATLSFVLDGCVKMVFVDWDCWCCSSCVDCGGRSEVALGFSRC
jgi:hypothetical protein